ncbi:MAG: hypothetical protein V4616_01160 [Bacteroidota bacterium]
MRSISALILFLFTLAGAYAQQPQALLQADTSRIRMGEQVKLTLSVFYSNQGKTALVNWPSIPDSLLGGKVLVTSRGAIDTLPMSNEDPAAMMQRRNIVVTAFDSAMYTVGPFAILVNGDSIFTNTIDIQAITFEVDTTKAIKDIKGVVDVPFGIWDWILENRVVILVGVAILVVIYVLIYLLRKRRKQQLTEPEAVIDTRTIDEIALDQLEKIRIEQRWNRVVPKVYYSELTDILRSYIEKRFKVLALEQTTAELLKSLRFSECPADERARLKEILSTADLVKFARQQPDEQTALMSIDMAIRFVQHTRTSKLPETGNEKTL